MFVLAYRTADDRQSFSQFYLPKVMVKDCNVITDKLSFFSMPIKTEEEAYEKVINISRNNEDTTGNLLDYDYFKYSSNFFRSLEMPLINCKIKLNLKNTIN